MPRKEKKRKIEIQKRKETDSTYNYINKIL